MFRILKAVLIIIIMNLIICVAWMEIKHMMVTAGQVSNIY